MTPGVSRGTRTIVCWRCEGASGSVLPITMRRRQRGSIAPLVHHLRPLTTYSSPSRSIRVAMLVASLLATSGSVIANAERIVPASNGSSQVFFCSSVPSRCSSSMLPVSGAWQLMASGASSLLQPDSSAIGAYSSWVSPDSAGQEQVPETPLPGLLLQLLDDRRYVVTLGARLPAVGVVRRFGRQHAIAHEDQHELTQLGGAGGGGRDRRLGIGVGHGTPERGRERG